MAVNEERPAKSAEAVAGSGAEKGLLSLAGANNDFLLLHKCLGGGGSKWLEVNDCRCLHSDRPLQSERLQGLGLDSPAGGSLFLIRACVLGFYRA